ncbi:hypothetical protein HK102_012288 [Quaeritorhiza haematococci]|nr:hypothetical protein HK102_012288 [Quaeritorhiza haematococci]
MRKGYISPSLSFHKLLILRIHPAQTLDLQYPSQEIKHALQSRLEEVPLLRQQETFRKEIFTSRAFSKGSEPSFGATTDTPPTVGSVSSPAITPAPEVGERPFRVCEEESATTPNPSYAADTDATADGVSSCAAAVSSSPEILGERHPDINDAAGSEMVRSNVTQKLKSHDLTTINGKRIGRRVAGFYDVLKETESQTSNGGNINLYIAKDVRTSAAVMLRIQSLVTAREAAGVADLVEVYRHLDGAVREKVLVEDGSDDRESRVNGAREDCTPSSVNLLNWAVRDADEGTLHRLFGVFPPWFTKYLDCVREVTQRETVNYGLSLVLEIWTTSDLTGS